MQSVAGKSHSFRESVQALKPCDHACLIYDSREELLATTISLIIAGLDRGERCICVVDENSADDIADALGAAGIDVDAVIDGGHLSVVAGREIFHAHNATSPELMVRYYREAIGEANSKGYPGLCIVNEMSWALGDLPGLKRLPECAAQLNKVLRESNTMVICQYNRRRFTPELILNVIYTHPLIILGGNVCKNSYYIPPEEFLKPHHPALKTERLLHNILELARSKTDLLSGKAELESATRRLQKEIHVRKWIEEELEQRVARRTEELESSNRELESFCYTVSHELRAPIARMEGFGRILEECVVEEDISSLSHYTERIIASARRMRTVIDTLLMIARLSRTDIVLERVDLSEIAGQVVAELLEGVEQRSVKVTVAPGICVQGDRQMLGICMRNLIGNAFKYTANKASAEIEFGLLFQSGKRVYFVKDNGDGFDMAFAGKLFQPFSRLHNESEFEGDGIGLATVKRIVERHGGRIWAEASPGQGASFFFTIGQ